MHAGFVTVGTFGSRSRMEYTIIGPNVNLASRLCGIAAPGQILTSIRTFFPVKHLVDARTIGDVEVKGLLHPVEIQEVLGRRMVVSRNGPAADEQLVLYRTLEQVVQDCLFRALVIGSPDRALVG